MAENVLSDVWQTFIEKSEALSSKTGAVECEVPGLVYSELAHLVAAQTAERLKKQHDAHVELVRSISKTSRGGRVVSPFILNGTLNGIREGGEIRGTIAVSRRPAPNGPLILFALLEEWNAKVAEYTASRARVRPGDQEEQFAWNMHLELDCLSPFKFGNGRTARISLNNIRLALGLSPYTFEQMGPEEYWAQVDAFRENIMIPKWVERGVL